MGEARWVSLLRHEGGEEVNHAVSWDRGVPSSDGSKCKGPDSSCREAEAESASDGRRGERLWLQRRRGLVRTSTYIWNPVGLPVPRMGICLDTGNPLSGRKGRGSENRQKDVTMVQGREADGLVPVGLAEVRASQFISKVQPAGIYRWVKNRMQENTREIGSHQQA